MKDNNNKEDKDITNLMLFKMFRQCSHLQMHRLSRYQGRVRILIMLNQRGAMTQKELTEELKRRGATMSEQLEKMEKDGLIVRSKNNSDRRNIDVVLTDEGRLMAEEVERERAAAADALFSVLSEREKVSLYEMLERLITLWEKTEAAQWPEGGSGQ